jgi:hypothetical protein
LEELWDKETPLVKTLHPDIFRLDGEVSSPSLSLPQAIDSLSASASSGNTNAIVDLLDELIPGSSIRGAPQPDMTFII